MEFDISRADPEHVAVYNLCTDTTRHMNGIVTNMHPSEGVWLFRCWHWGDPGPRARRRASASGR